MRCACLATVREALRRRGVPDPGDACGGLPLRLEPPHPGRQPALDRRPHRRRARLLRRALVRRVLLPRHRRGGRTRRHLQRPARRQLRERRGHVRRRVGGCGGGRGRRGAARRGQRVAGRLQPGADHPGPAVLLLGAAPVAPAEHPATPGNPAAGGGRAVGEPGRAGTGRRDRAGRAGGAAVLQPGGGAAGRPRGAAAAGGLFRQPGPRLPVHPRSS